MEKIGQVLSTSFEKLTPPGLMNDEKERRKGSGRPSSVRTQENKDEVEDMIFSQEDPETSEWKRHESPRLIAQRLGVSKNSVYRIMKIDLDLRMFHRIKGQNLTGIDHEKRLVRCKRMLRYFL